MGDGVPLRSEFLARARGTEEFVGVAARSGVGRPGENVLGLGVVQRVVEPRDRARGIAERGMGGHVLDALAIDVDVTSITQAGEIFRARERSAFGGNEVLGLHRGRFLRRPGRKALAEASVNAPPAAVRSGRKAGWWRSIGKSYWVARRTWSES